MNLAKTIKDDVEIINFLKRTMIVGHKVWLWQNGQNESERRFAHLAIVVKVDPIKSYIELRPIDLEHQFRFKSGVPIFFYSEENSFAFRLSIKKFEPSFIGASLPVEVRIVSESFKEGLQIVEKEDEEKFSHMRTAPRSSAKEGQSVGVCLEGGQNGFYFLHDISKGGCAFLIDDPGAFTVGEKLTVDSVDGNPLQKRLNGEIVSIRKLEEVGGKFKVGVKFS